MRTAPGIVLSGEEQAELQRLARSKRTAARLAQRARIVLLAAKGLEAKAIAAKLDVGPLLVSRWIERYAQLRLPGIERGLPRGAAPGKAAARAQPRSAARARATGEGDSLRDNVIALKRNRILQEAAQLFFDRGYLQTSVDAIAERLGATKPFVYYHFNSKLDILVELCERSIRDTLAAAESAMSSQGSPRLRFEKFLREFTAVVLNQRQLVAIYFREDINLPKDAAERINQMRKAINQRLGSLLGEGIAAGEFQIEDPHMGALVIAGMSSYAFAWYRERGRLSQQEVTDRIVQMALKLVSAAGQQKPTLKMHSLAGA